MGDFILQKAKDNPNTFEYTPILTVESQEGTEVRIKGPNQSLNLKIVNNTIKEIERKINELENNLLRLNSVRRSIISQTSSETNLVPLEK